MGFNSAFKELILSYCPIRTGCEPQRGPRQQGEVVRISVADFGHGLPNKMETGIPSRCIGASSWS